MRTDLAIESPTFLATHPLERKISSKCKHFGEKNFLKIETDEEEKQTGKPKGDYITLKFRDLLKYDDQKEIKEEIIESLNELLTEKYEKILVVGLGNREITSDSIGPLVAKKVLATRHIAGNFAEKIGLKGIKSVSVLAPDVLGKTGIEAAEIIRAVVDKIKPDLLIVADALAAGSIKRIFTTIQLCNSGITPGSGVKNSRKEISENTMGVPVIAIGVPTVVDALSLSFEISGKEALFDTDLIVTPKEVDIQCHKITEIIASALNIFLQPEIEREVIEALV